MNTKNKSKQRWLKAIVLCGVFLLQSYMYAQQLPIHTTVPSHSLQVGAASGTFGIVIRNTTASPVQVQSVVLNHYQGVVSPDSLANRVNITINGNQMHENLSGNIYNPQQSINPGDSLVISYPAVAGCAAIVSNPGEVRNNIAVTYSNGTVQNIQTDPYGINWPHLTVGSGGTQTVLVEGGSEYSMIVPVRNAVGAGAVNQLRFEIEFPESARPLPQNMNPDLSLDGTNWISGIWPRTTIGNRSTYVFSASDYGMFSGGKTLHIRFPLQLSPGLVRAEVPYTATFNQSIESFCSNYNASGSHVLVTEVGDPSIRVSVEVSDSISLCDSIGQMRYTIRNIGTGPAIFTRLYFTRSSQNRLHINSVTTTTGEPVPFDTETFVINGATSQINNGFSDLNGDGVFLDLAAGEEIDLLVNYTFLGYHGTFFSYSSMTLHGEYESINGNSQRIDDPNRIITDGISGIEQMVAFTDTIKASDGAQPMEITINTSAIRHDILGEREYFVEISAPPGFSVNGEGNIYRESGINFSDRYNPNNRLASQFFNTLTIAVDSTVACGPHYINYRYGVRQPLQCGENSPESYFIPNDSVKVLVLNEFGSLVEDVNNIVLNNFDIRRLHNSWHPVNIGDGPITLSDLNNLQQFTDEEQPNPHRFFGGDTVRIIFQGQMFVEEGCTPDNVFLSFHDDVPSFNTTVFQIIRSTFNLNDNQIVREGAISWNNTIGYNLQQSIEGIELSGVVDLSFELIAVVKRHSNMNRNMHANFGFTCNNESIESCYLNKKYHVEYYTLNYSANANACGINARVLNSVSNPIPNVFPGEYHPVASAHTIYIDKIEGLYVDAEDVQVNLYSYSTGVETPLEFTYQDSADRIYFNLKDTILIDPQFHEIRFSVIADTICTISSSSIRIYILSELVFGSIDYDLASGITYTNFPFMTVAQAHNQLATGSEVVWEIEYTENGNGSVPNIAAQIFPSEIGAEIEIQNIYFNGIPVIFEMHGDTVFFQFGSLYNSTKTLRIEALIKNCESNTDMQLMLRSAITCSPINYSDFRDVSNNCFDRELNVQTGNFSLIPSQPTSNQNYYNLCDTVSYGINISPFNADSSAISFWFDALPDNVVIVDNNVNYSFANGDHSGNMTIGGNGLFNRYNRAVSEFGYGSVLYNNWDSDITNLNFGVIITCNPDTITDITQIFGYNVSRQNACGDTILERYSYTPKIIGFERLDSIKIDAVALGFLPNGEAEITVTATNLYPSLVDSVNISALLPAGVEYIQGSTHLNVFDTIIVTNNEVVWAFKRGEHLMGNEVLEYSFRVRNLLPCSPDSAFINIRSSLQREVESCEYDGKCIVEATSDTAQVGLERIPPQHIADIIYPETVCVNEAFTVTVATNTSDVEVSFTSNLQASISVDNLMGIIIPQVSGIHNINVVASGQGCNQDTTIAVNVLAADSIVIEPISSSIDPDSDPIQLRATPHGGTWSGNGISDSTFNPSVAGIGSHWLVYTYTNEAGCVSKDSILVETIVDCMPFVTVKSVSVCGETSEFYVDVTISEILECPECLIYNMKLDLAYDMSAIQYVSYSIDNTIFTDRIQPDIIFVEDDNLLKFQIYGNEINSFNGGSTVIRLNFVAQSIGTTNISVVDAYFNGDKEVSIDGFRDGIVSIIDMPTVSLPDSVIICLGTSYTALPEITPENGTFSYIWTLDDEVVSTERDAIFTNAGNYTLNIIQSGCSANATFTLVVDSIDVNVADVSICQNDTALVSASVESILAIANYSWNTGATTQSISVVEDGLYSVVVTNDNGCTGSDSATVIINPLPIVEVEDAEIVNNQSVILQAVSIDNVTYQWINGPATSSWEVAQAGEYIVFVTNQFGCSNSDTAIVTVKENEIDTVYFCYNNGGTHIDAGSGIAYSWSTGADYNPLWVGEAGTYIATVTQADGSVNEKTIVVAVVPQIIQFVDWHIEQCPNTQFVIDAGEGHSQYFWNGVEGSSVHIMTNPGNISLRVIDTFGCEHIQGSINRAWSQSGTIVINQNEAFTGTNSVLLSVNNYDFENFIWSTGETTRTITVNDAGIYNVTATNVNTTCEVSATHQVVADVPLITIEKNTSYGSLVLDAVPTTYHDYQWFYTGNNISGGSSLWYLPGPGEYRVDVYQNGIFIGSATTTVVMENGQLKSGSDIEDEVYFNIELINESSEITIEPIPASNYITIKSKNDIVNVEITNLQGKVILLTTNLSYIDVSSISEGLYNVKIVTTNETVVKRISIIR